MDYKIEKMPVPVVPVVIAKDTPTVYVKKQLTKDVDGTEYVRSMKYITREALVSQKEAIEAEIAEIDKLSE